MIGVELSAIDRIRINTEQQRQQRRRRRRGDRAIVE